MKEGGKKKTIYAVSLSQTLSHYILLIKGTMNISANGMAKCDILHAKKTKKIQDVVSSARCFLTSTANTKC